MTAIVVDDERALVEQAQAGDRDAFGRLYLRHRWTVVGYLRDRMRNDDEAEVDDIAAEAFVLALDTIGTFFPERAGFATWLTGIARHLMLDRWRLQERHPELELVPEWNPALTDDPEEVACLRLELTRLLARLTPRARRVLLLQCLAGLSGDEVAHIVGLSESMVRFLTSQARATLTEKPNWAMPAGQKGARTLPPALCACGCGVALPADRKVTARFATPACRYRLRRKATPALLDAPTVADPAVDRVLAAIVAAGADGTTRADLNRRLRLPAARLDRIIALLADRGQVHERREVPTATTRRPVFRYFAVRRATAGRAA